LRLRRRRFTEVGQPINQLTMLPRTLCWIRRAGLIAKEVAGQGHYLLLPGRKPRRIEWLDLSFLKWFAMHGLVVAQNPGYPWEPMLNFKPLPDNHPSRTIKFFVGLRKASTSVSPAEHALLVSLSAGKHCIVEVGVFEGVTSEIFCRVMDPGGRL